MKKLVMTVAALGGVTLFAGNALAASDAYCRSYAQQEVNRYANPVGSAALGCLGGGVIGSLLSNGNGGAIAGGCVAGGATGLVLTDAKRNEIYNQAYWSCRGNGGGPVQPVYDPGPPPPGYGQQWWMQSCAGKYNSFQWTGPHAGQFKGYDGYWHWCSL